MTTAVSVVSTAESWRRLFSLSSRQSEDLGTLTERLAAWCQGAGLEGAALYANADGVLRSQVRCGEGDFPDPLTDASVNDPNNDGEQGDVGAWRRLELVEGPLLFRGPATVEIDGDLLLIAAGARISILKKQVQRQSFEANFRGVELEALYDVGLAITKTLDLESLGGELLIHAVSLLDARRGALYLLDDGTYRLQSHLGGTAVPSFAVDDCAELDADTLPGAEFLEAAPIEVEGRRRGLLLVADKESRRGVGPFSEKDCRTLSLFANQAAIALENAKLHRLALEKERMEREMELAVEIQQQILPKAMPNLPGFEVLGWNRPARQVGGDYFDIRPLDGDRWGLVVGDVTGKGMPAALLVSTFHSALRLLADRVDIGPTLVERLNAHIFESSSANKFITMLLAELDTETARLRYLNAGHNPGLVVRASGEAEELPSAGLPLGLMPNGRYHAAELALEHGDLLCLYSDGITECESPAEEEYGMERLQDLLFTNRQLPLGEIVVAIDRAMLDFAAGLPQGDDQTVVLLRRS